MSLLMSVVVAVVAMAISPISIPFVASIPIGSGRSAVLIHHRRQLPLLPLRGFFLRSGPRRTNLPPPSVAGGVADGQSPQQRIRTEQVPEIPPAAEDERLWHLFRVFVF